MQSDPALIAMESGTRLQDLAWMVLILPLIASIGTLFWGPRDRTISLAFNIGNVVLAFIISVVLLVVYAGQEIACTPFHWLPIPGLDLTIGLRLDTLTTLMLPVVTGVAALVMVYSVGYMRDDPGFNRFFTTLSLFVFSMLGIVLADNLVMLFIFWELVGVSSYLLIGFWYKRPAAGDAAKKAFLTNRLGDFGFILGILLIWGITGTINIAELSAKLAADPNALGAWAGVAGLLIFMGAMGKSAQFPLHVWLPDAMEGPTPVSALIHAATMVAAGVYMLLRVFALYTVPPGWSGVLSFLGDIPAGSIIAWIGGLTALMAGLIALQQDDIKRILAYSTLSQLGYMILAVGLGATTGNPGAALFHLVTHAFFKAMLFLGAGAVIHACHHEQNIWKMGGLRKKMPVTFWTFVIGTAALAGVPPLSGFYSKDEILVTALEAQPVLFGLAVIVAVLTTLYMARLVLIAFMGEARSDDARSAHEVPASMRWPLILLAIPSVGLGWLPLGEYIGRHFNPAIESHGVGILFGPFNHSPMAALFGLGAVIFGLSLAWALYGSGGADPLPRHLGGWARLLRNRFYFDEIYEATVIPLHDMVAGLVNLFDRWILSGLILRGLHGGVDLVGRGLRLVQSGNLQTYSFLFAVGIALLAWFALR